MSSIAAEKTIKDMLQITGRDSATCVLDTKHGLLTRFFDAKLGGYLAFGKCEFDRVIDQVIEDLSEVLTVSLNDQRSVRHRRS